eukprot:9952223-Alexandrium_andersonii.AAC.1
MGARSPVCVRACMHGLPIGSWRMEILAQWDVSRARARCAQQSGTLCHGSPGLDRGRESPRGRTALARPSARSNE